MPAAAPPAPVCTSCGDQLSRAEAQYASAQAGRCASCQQLHQAGNYCRVCDKVRQATVASQHTIRQNLFLACRTQRELHHCPVWQVWKPTDKNMVGCDGCDFWIHDHCDAQAARVLASNAEDEQYFCPHCRQASAAQVSCTPLACRTARFSCCVHTVACWGCWGRPGGQLKGCAADTVRFTACSTRSWRRWRRRRRRCDRRSPATHAPPLRSSPARCSSAFGVSPAAT